MKILIYRVPPTQSSTKIIEPASTNLNSTITDIDVPTEIYEAETIICPVSSPTELMTILLFPFRKGDKWGFSDSDKKFIIEAKYDNAYRFSEGLAPVKSNDKHGFIDKTGKEVIPLKYDRAYPFSDGLAKVTLNGNEFYIDKNGTEYYEP